MSSGNESRPPHGPNRLSSEKSPYLLQHAHNPVDWYPWGEEAFTKARRENRPVFLSIGYSTCHWCHVMERESFENEQIAALMNRHFVCIKVDREERPDIDNIYMNAAYATSGGGGWPLSVFMTPAKRPFFCGTYFPPQDYGGRPGFATVLQSIAKQWDSDRDQIDQLSKEVVAHLKTANPTSGKTTLTDTIFPEALERKKREFEPKFGGFSGGPKFPMGHSLSMLLRLYRRNKDENALSMAAFTLDNMASGGIYDQLGGGFHRYSVDNEWLVPHFEKMLYDQALLAIAYLEAWQITQNSRYERIVGETLEYVLRDMTHADGGFFSAEDADSEGEEGKFYLWTREEILGLLDPETAELFCEFYAVTFGGNFEGKTILTAHAALEEFAAERNTDVAELGRRLDDARTVLLATRAKRIRPSRDEKILVDWNGLMISALAKAARVLEAPQYADAATRAADFILTHIRREDGRLLKHWQGGSSAHLGMLEDYAFFACGLIDLFLATFDPKWLNEAMTLADAMIELFWDASEGGFFLTGNDGESLILRPKEVYDSAIPSGNGAALLVLARLAHLTNERRFREKVEATVGAFAASIIRHPTGGASFLNAFDVVCGPRREIVIAGDPEAPEVGAFLSALHRRFLPRTITVVRPPTDSEALDAVVPFMKHHRLIDGKPAFYVCQDYTCQLPTTGVEEALALVVE